MAATLDPQKNEIHLTSRKLKILLWFLLLAAGAEFVVRGPLRLLREPSSWNDLSQSYTESRLWLKGQNPANPDNFVALWKQQSGLTVYPKDVRAHSAPPPGTLVIIAPFAAFSWPVAEVLWLIVLLISFALTVWALLKVSRLDKNESRSLLFIAGCLALAPFHTGIASGNCTVLVIAACCVAIWAADCRRDITAGLLFGVACSLKPHIGAFLVLYYLVRRRWRIFNTAVAMTVVLVMIMALWMQIRGVSWVQDYIHNTKVVVAENRIDDFRSSNPIRFTLINLQVPFFEFTRSSSAANLLALSAGALLILIWMYLITRSSGANIPEPGSDLMPLATIAVIALLPLYHRFYDAGLLAIPLCWCMCRTGLKFRKVSLTALLLMTPFLVPGTAFLQQLIFNKRIPETMTRAWWWDRLVMPHETWLLLLLSLVLLYGMAVEHRDASSSV